MSRHPAPEELLLDYAAGTLAEGPALAVALHVALDRGSRHLVQGLAVYAGELLDSEQPPAMGEDTLAATLARIDALGMAPPITRPPRNGGIDWAPAPLAPYLKHGAPWKKVVGGFEEIRLSQPGDDHRMSLLRLQPGHGLPVHRHVATEYTVVLQGGYSDVTGRYGVGDFAVGPGEQEHEPIADPGEPCIALIVVEKPIVLTGRWGRWLNPLLRRGWM